MTITSYEQAVKYLESFIGKIIFKVDKEFVKKHDPLERMRIFLSLLGDPQEKFRSILVGGTSGKGSTAYLLSHILKTSGYKVGFTTSPHLQKVNERLQINGKQIIDKEFTNLMNSILSSIEGMKKMQVGAPSYFEILIAMAFLYFAKEKVDIAVVEVGMGGEFDATNTLYPLISVLTNVGLDHTNVLGKTVEKIAKTKAGIIKKLKVENGKLKNNSQLSTLNSQLIVVAGVKQPSVIKIVEDKCKEVGAKLYRLGKDFTYKIKQESIEGSVFDLTIDSDRIKKLNDLQLSLIGKYQVENTSLAIEAVLNLKKFGFKVSENDIRKALKTAFFPGRFEIIRVNSSKFIVHGKNYEPSTMNHLLILDGAHNPTKMKSFLKSLKKIFPKERKVFIIGFKFDKDISKMLKEITKVADIIIITEFNRATDMSISASAEALNVVKDIKILRYEDTKVNIEKDSKKALEEALNILISQYPNIPSVIVVTGSLYLVGEVRSML